MNEWEFTSNAAKWIAEIIQRTPGLGLGDARCEQTGKGSRKRRDLTVLDRDKRIILTGEVKLPYQEDGNTPYNTTVVQDARAKARRARADYFFTWNVNDFVLWPTDVSASGAWQDRSYKNWHVTGVRKAEDLERASTESDIRKWLAQFLVEFSQIVQGTALIGTKAPDEKFIDVLESSLQTPIHFVASELDKQYQTHRFKRELDAWMVKEQNWTVLTDPEGVRDNLERTAKFTCYSLVNKLVFHEALLKRYGVKMRKLTVPKHITKGEELRTHIEGFFAKAKDATGDYETVFGEEHTGIGNRIPFCSDHAVSHWRGLIEQIHEYDFTQLEHEVIGSIFERLIGPEERKKYGQFYTRVEVVDLINSFCIREGDEKVMDPACGAGTFLVRAYGRKRELQAQRSHTELLTDLYGVDIARYATEWTTINLATRELVEEENYPRVKQDDFFDVAPHSKVLSLPKHIKTKGLGKTQHHEIEIPDLDAIIGNLPYIRQESIRKSKNKVKGKPERGTKEYYQQLAKTEGGVQLSGRSDIHCYFWPHAASFLKQDGYLCFLTSSQWLDVAYGFRLQDWLLRNFEIVAVLESIDEPWFVGARVATTVTIARRQADVQKRMNNTVRFVQLRKPMRELLAAADHTMAATVRAVDGFRDEILALSENTVNERYRARLVRQGQLWEDGVKLGKVMSKAEPREDDEDGNQNGEYYGGKWGVFLRAPDLWFEILDRYSDHLVPLGDIAEIRRGITSGNDAFFFPVDASAECLESFKDKREFEREYGVSRQEVAAGKVKLVKCGEGHGEIRPIEVDFLEPEVHNLREIDGFVIPPENCTRQILLVGKRKNQLKGTYVLDYIKWGEGQGVHKGSTCSSRVTDEREWYDLTGHKRGSLFWPMTQKYKHAIPVNSHNLICNHNLFDITPKAADSDVLGAVLNSSLVVLSKLQHGRWAGTEGTLKTEVVDVNMMLVPEMQKGSNRILKKIADIFEEMKKRDALQLLSERRLRRAAYSSSGRTEELEQLSDQSELDMADRKALDDAVLELLGESNGKERERILGALYSSLREIFERNKQIEEKANLNKIISGRRGAARPEDVAGQILEDIKAKHGELLRTYEGDFLDMNKPFDTYEVPAEGEPEPVSDMILDNGVAFVRGRKRIKLVETRNAAQSGLLVVAVNSGLRGFIRVPHDARECKRVWQAYDEFVQEREHAVRRLIEERTADEDFQEKIYEALMGRMGRG